MNRYLLKTDTQGVYKGMGCVITREVSDCANAYYRAGEVFWFVRDEKNEDNIFDAFSTLAAARSCWGFIR